MPVARNIKFVIYLLYKSTKPLLGIFIIKTQSQLGIDVHLNANVFLVPKYRYDQTEAFAETRRTAATKKLLIYNWRQNPEH